MSPEVDQDLGNCKHPFDWVKRLFEQHHGARFASDRTMPHFVCQQPRQGGAHVHARGDALSFACLVVGPQARLHVCGPHRHLPSHDIDMCTLTHALLVHDVTRSYPNCNFKDLTRDELENMAGSSSASERRRLLSGLRGWTSPMIGTVGHHHSAQVELRSRVSFYEHVHGGTASLFPMLTSPDVHSDVVQGCLLPLSQPDLDDVAGNLGTWQERFDRLATDPRGAQHVCAGLLKKLTSGRPRHAPAAVPVQENGAVAWEIVSNHDGFAVHVCTLGTGLPFVTK